MLGGELDWPQDYSVVRGDFFDFQFQVENLDATGATVTMFFVAANPGAGAPSTPVVTVVYAPNGMATSSFVWQVPGGITAAWVPGTYEYRIQFTDTANRGRKFGHGVIVVT